MVRDLRLSLVEAYGFPGREPPLHYHEVADEFFYVIDGDMTSKVGEEIKRIGNSGFVWIPRTVVHGFSIHSNSSKFLFGFTPAGLEQMFFEMSTPVGIDTSGSTAPPESVSGANTADDYRERHRTIVVGPPLRKFLDAQS